MSIKKKDIVKLKNELPEFNFYIPNFSATDKAYKSLMEPIKKKKIKYKGQTVTYKTWDELKKKLKLDSIEKAKELTKKNPKRIILAENGDFGIQKLKDKPLIIRKLGVKRITNNNLLDLNGNLKNLIVQKDFKPNDLLNIKVHFTITFWISEEHYFKEFTRAIRTKYSNIAQAVRNAADIFMANFIFNIDPDSPVRYEATILSNFTDQQIDFIESRLRELFSLKVEDFDNIEENNNKDCVKAFLRAKLPKIGPKTINNLGNELGVSIKEIIEFCKIYSIEIYAYNINCELKASYIPQKRNKSYPILVFLAYGNHLYPVTNKYLQKRKNKNIDIVLIEDGYSKLLQFLEKDRIKPSEIKYSGYDHKLERPIILSFIANNKKFIQNDEYKSCLTILEKYGLKDKIFDSIKFSHLFNIIEKIYIKEDCSSFLPGTIPIIKGGFNYVTSEIFDKKDINAIDKNKSYASALKELPYLIKCDYRTCTISKNPKRIISHYLYVAKPENSSILLPNTNIYPGYHLKYSKNEGLKFTLLEELTTTKINFNYYTKMINDLFINVDMDTFKKIMVIGIGKMENFETISEKTIVKNVYNNEEIKTETGFAIRLNDNFSILCDTELYYCNLYNKRPISLQIKDMARRMVYDQMKKMNLSSDKIIQIKTDSIVFKGDLPNDLDFGLEGWKEDKKFTLMKSTDIYDDDCSFISFKPEQEKSKVLNDCYAGSGKTYDILTNLIPQLEKEGKKYIVLTPSHNAGKIYKQKGINHKVIHYYTIANKIPCEDIIIIDEFGFCDTNAHDMLYKCFLTDKEYYAYGDFKQLLPVENGKTALPLNSTPYLDLLFTKKNEMTDNHRNDFTKHYYDQLMNEEINIIDEVVKYSTEKYYDADCIICWYNKTVKTYNKLMMNYLGLKDFDIGLKLICKTNNLLDKNISHNSVEKIVNVDNDKITLSNGEIYTRKEISLNFQPGYARTCYGVQGDSLQSYHYAEEDLLNLDGRKAYMIISRLKTKYL